MKYTNRRPDGVIEVRTEIPEVNKILVMPGAAVYPAIAVLAEYEDAENAKEDGS